MSNEVIDTTDDYLEAADAADNIEFSQQYCVDSVYTLLTKFRSAWIHGYMAALAAKKGL